MRLQLHLTLEPRPALLRWLASSAGTVGDDDDNGGDDAGDDDFTSAKQRANRLEAVSYGPNDDADDEIQKAIG
ncbi:hypothetical protein J3459_014141 [Metarhizium acridum]|nr:hypothetical protein J3459_014141 [Metarhizium acridum]